MDKVLGQSVEFRIEVEDNPKSILLVLDRRTDVAFVPWQDACKLANMMSNVIAKVRGEFVQTLNHRKVVEEQAQIRLNHHKGLVVLVVEWTDRLRFTSLEAFHLVAQALRKEAQDAYLEKEKELHIVYNKDGTIKKLHNARTGITQVVR